MRVIQLPVNKTSTKGWSGVLISFLMVLSISGTWRIPIAGMLMHPYLIVLPLAIIFGKVQLFNVDRKILIPALLYMVFFSLPMALEGNFPEILKIAAGVITFLFFIGSISTQKDLLACSWGLIITAIVLSIQIILLGQASGGANLEGINALEGLGNKNAQSQFTIPGFFFICLQFFLCVRDKKYMKSMVFLVLSIPVILGAALTGNRSGFLSIIVTVLVLLAAFRFSFSGIFLSVLIAIVSYLAVSQYAFDIFEHKYEQTTSGEFESDHMRQELIMQSLTLGLENPFPGLGFKGLAEALAERIGLRYRDEIDPHNLYGYLLGAGGMITFISFIFLFYGMFSESLRYYRLKQWFEKFYRGKLFDGNVTLWLIGFLFVFLFRSLFTRELIYSPHFMAALGLLVGYLMLHRRYLLYAIRTQSRLSNP